MGGSASVWGVNPKADWVGEGVAFILVRAPTDGNRSCYPWLEGSNIIRPSIPKCDRFVRNLNLYFFQLSSTTPTDSLLADQTINQALKKPTNLYQQLCRTKTKMCEVNI